MLPALLGAGARGIVKGGGRVAASKIMGRKKTVKPSAVAPKQGEQQQQQKKGGALVKSPTAAIAKQMAPIKQVSTSKVAKDDYLGIIHEKVLLIENILKGVRDAEKDNVKQKKKAQQDEDRANQEKKLEAKDKKPENKLKMPSVPKLGIFGWIKRFIGNVVAAIFLSKMVDHVGMLVGFVKVADKVLNFVADVGIKLVDALGTMVEFGYRAYDATRGFLETIGGNGLAQNFDKVMGLVGTALTLATAITLDAAMDAASGGGDGPGLLDFMKGKGATKGATAVKGAAAAKGTAATGTAAGGTATAASTGTSAGAGAVAGAVIGAGLAFSALGEGIFQLRKFGLKYQKINQEKFEKASWFNPLKYIMGASLAFQKLIDLPLMFFQHVFDLLGAPFRYAIELIRFGVMALFGDTEGMKKQRKNLAKFDARIRENIRQMLNMVTLGFGFKEKGSFGNIFGDKESQAEMMYQMQEGGKVKGSKGKAKRRLRTRKKPKKLILKKPPRELIEPLPAMTESGDDEKQKQNKERAWWDFLGWAGTGEGTPLGPAGQQLAEKVRNVGNELGKNDYFGPILRVTSKVILNQEVDPQDYKRVAMGMNLMINEGLKKGKINQGMFAFNEGGLSDAAGVRPIDASTWIENSFGSLIRRERTKDFMGTTRSTVTKSKSGSTAGPGTAAGERDSATGVLTSLGSGGGSLKDMTDQDFSDLAFIVSAEAARNTDDEYGVAAAVLNRVADPRFPNTIMGVGTAPGQFEAVYKGLAVRDEVLAKKLKENQGKIVEALKELQGRTDFKGQSQLDNKGDTDIMFAPSGNFYHYLEQVGKTDPVPSSVPQDWKKLLGESTGEEFTPSPSIPSGSGQPSDTDASSGGDIKISGSGIVNIGKDLISKGFSVAEHPDFTKTPTASGGTYTPGKGYVSNVHQGDGHYDGRAIDVTDWRGSMEDSKARYRSVLTSLQDNPAIKMLIHDSWGAMYGGPGTKQGPGRHSHPEHMHIEVKDKGGFIGKGLFANLGGTEFVTDADSTAALKQVAPGLMMGLNQARDKSGVANVLSSYASYEQGAQQTVMIQNSQMPSEESESKGSSGSGLPPMPQMPSESPFDFLDYQG